MTEIGESAFYGCSSLVKIEIPVGVEVIPESAFHDCISLTKVTLPEGLKEIGDYAFSGCYYLDNLRLPKGLISIGDAGNHQLADVGTVRSLRKNRGDINTDMSRCNDFLLHVNVSLKKEMRLSP